MREATVLLMVVQGKKNPDLCWVGAERMAIFREGETIGKMHKGRKREQTTV
jgi:hypothetical protein